MGKSILIIDDDLYIVNLLDNFFKKEGYSTHTLSKGKPALQLLQKKEFDVVLCDIRLPDIDGTELLQQIRHINPDIVVIMMTAYAEIKVAVESIKAGAFDYITKPIHPDNISNIVKNALKRKTGQRDDIEYDFIAGNSARMQEVIGQSKLVAPTDMAVLIQGETGSGKEYIARLIHNHSQRKSKKFVAIDCGAIPKELAASELFGHVKGAFTGAVSNKKGYFEQAKDGTIFMDEIGNLSYETQVKLLRAIQQKVITRVGDTQPIEIDVRIISATNSNLTEQAREGSFREDLYHRINEFILEIPPLRERDEDIMLFAHHFLKQACKELNKEVDRFDPAVESAFYAYHWYGNLREMRNVIKRSVLIAKDKVITTDCLPKEIKPKSESSPISYDNPLSELSLRVAAQQAERSIIENALKKARYNKSEAARILKIDRKTLYNKIKELGMEM
ncbi:MAG: sigma-54-dependent Fis family transcriptional regulator [Bacteroidetes bacterium]|nr:MAG: sigma-54-dependent Fis family transcriptional regulator [Bacteroidota bacterium]